MFETFDKDRYFIERKYHDPDAPFDPYKRMAARDMTSTADWTTKI